MVYTKIAWSTFYTYHEYNFFKKIRNKIYQNNYYTKTAKSILITFFISSLSLIKFIKLQNLTYR